MTDAMVKEGLLSYLSTGVFMKRYKEYYVLLLDASLNGLARLEVHEVGRSSACNKHVLVLVSGDIIKVIQEDAFSRNEGRGFTVTTRDKQHYFLARNAKESEKWVKAIQETLLKPRAPARQAMQVNGAYMSQGEACPNFPVRLDKETRLKLRVGECVRLLVEKCAVTLVSLDGKKIVCWTISQVRRFGFSTDTFEIEVGRKSKYGPGTFTFITSQGEGIQRLIQLERERLKYQMTMHPRDSSKQRHTPESSSPASTPPLPEPLIPDHIYDTIETKKPALFTQSMDLQAESTSLHSEDLVYSNPEEIRNAWVNHGYGCEDQMEAGGRDTTYDVLEFMQPREKGQQQQQEQKQPQGAADCRGESGITEPIYSQIIHSKKIKHRSANAGD